MKRYTEKLSEMLGIIVYGVAQVYDVPLDEVMTEVLIIIDTPWRRPEELFQSSKPSANNRQSGHNDPDVCPHCGSGHSCDCSPHG